nr:unnamed protein product [Trichobilharzia regenti]
MKQKASNPYYTILQHIDLKDWYHLNCNVVGEPEWCLNPMKCLENTLENEPYENRKKIIGEWNQERDFIAWIFHYVGNLCLHENLITEEEFNMLILTEFSSTLSSLIKSTDVNYETRMNHQLQTEFQKIPINTDWIFSDPIVLHRDIIDIQHFVQNEPNVGKFIDIAPKLVSDSSARTVNGVNYNALKHQPVVDQLLQDNLQILVKQLIQKITYSNVSYEDQAMKVLWRSPNGIDQKFHSDYLNEFLTRIKKLACEAIDRRASTKTALMLPNLSVGLLESQNDEVDMHTPDANENLDSRNNASLPTIILPQLQNRHTYVAREFQKRIKLWDNVWNALNYVNWLIPIASSYRNEIETLLCYIEDTDPTAQVPMLVYSTSEASDKLDVEQFCLANAVAACCFQETQNRLSMKSNECIILIRIYTSPTIITDALQDLAEQVSFALQINCNLLEVTTLSSFLHSLSCLEEKYTPKSIVIIIGGIDYLEANEYQDSLEGLLPILQAKQLPKRLASGIKLILSGNLKVTKLKEGSKDEKEAAIEVIDGILLPTTSLNLEISSDSLSGGFSSCIHNLTKLNYCLTNDQLIRVHDLFKLASKHKDLPILACAAGLCLLPNLTSQNMEVNHLLSKLVHTHFSDFISNCGKYFNYDSVKHLVCLLISVSNKKLIAPGMTLNELQEILSLSDRAFSGQNDGKCSQNTVSFYDTASLLLMLYSFEKSLTARLGQHHLICSMDGFFVYKLSVMEKLDNKRATIIKDLLKGYFLNEQFDKTKNSPLMKEQNTSPLSVYFKAPYINDSWNCSQDNCDSRILMYNVRYLRHLPFCLLNSKDFNEFSYQTVFHFDWLYGMIYALGVRPILDCLKVLIDMLSCLDNQSNSSENAMAIRFEASIIQNILSGLNKSLYNNPDSLPTEMIGYLLPFTSGIVNDEQQKLSTGRKSLIDLLVKQCEIKVVEQSNLLPLFSYPLTPGNSLLGQIMCPTPLLSLHNFNQGSTAQKPNNQILIKLKNDPMIYRYHCERDEEVPPWKSSSGYSYLTPNGKYAIVIDEEKRDTLKIHQIDIDINGCVPLIGQINAGLWINPLWSKHPHDESLKMEIIFLDITNDYVGFIVQTRNTRSFLNPSEYVESLEEYGEDEHFDSNTNGSINPKVKDEAKDITSKSVSSHYLPETLAAGTINHVVIFELITGKPLHLLSPTPCATLVKLVQTNQNSEKKKLSDNKDDYDDEDENLQSGVDLFFINSFDHLLGFHMKSGEQQFSVDLNFVPRKIVASNDNQRLFILDSNNPCILQLHINRLGQINKSFRISYDDLITKDNIIDVKLSRYYSFLLLHAKKNVLVYDYENDAVFVHITRPAGIPREFRLPNSKYQKLVFTAVEFALNDQVVLAAIFRNILIWDIRLGVQLTTLTSSVGVISRLLVDSSEQQLVGYISTSKVLNLWNLPLALTNAALKQSSNTLSSSNLNDSNRMDCLTKPVDQMRYSESSKILLVTCQNSDELGVFNLQSGHLTDMFTHNGIVKSAVLSSCGNYALIGLAVDMQTKGNANLIWDLDKRSIVAEYGEMVGFHVGRVKHGSHFFHLMPKSPMNSSDNQRFSYSILGVEVTQNNKKESKAVIKPVALSKISSIATGSKPFMTSDDQHLVMILESDDQLKQGFYICQEIAFWSLYSSAEHESIAQDGKLWYTHTKELKTLLTDNMEYGIHILNCEPVQNNSSQFLVFFTKFNASIKSNLSIDWNSGVGLSKGILLAEILQTDQVGLPRDWMLVVLRSITGLSEQSPFKSIHYSFLKHELFDSFSGHYYFLPLGIRHISRDYFNHNRSNFMVETKNFTRSDSVKFHGCILHDDLCIFSHYSTLYLIQPRTAEIFTFIDVHHIITSVNKNIPNDDILFVGTTDGFIISYQIIKSSEDDSNKEDNLLVKLKEIHLNLHPTTDEHLDKNVNFHTARMKANISKQLNLLTQYTPLKFMKPDDFRFYQQCENFGEKRLKIHSLV